MRSEGFGAGLCPAAGMILLASALLFTAESTQARQPLPPSPSTQSEGLAPQADITILHQDERGLVVEFRPRYRDRTIAGDDGTLLTIVDFDGASSQGLAAGSPDLRFRMFAVAFPGAEGNTATVIASDYRDRQNVDLAPVPTYEDRDGIPSIAGYRRDGALYRSTGFLPTRVAELRRPGMVRTALVGGLVVNPVQYDPRSRTLRQYSRVVVEVVFGSGPRVSSDDPLVRPSVLNAASLQSWRPSAARARVGAPVPSVLATGDWYRLTVTEEGIYRLDSKFLTSAGINLTGLDPRTIKIYGNGGGEVPEDITASRIADLGELAIYVEGESDGKFDASDYILLYGRGPQVWEYDARAKTFHHRIHHYSTENYYWLTFAGSTGKRMAGAASSSSPPGLVTQTFTDRLFVEEEKVNLLRSGKDWYGQSFPGPSSSFTYMNKLTDIVPDRTITYRYNLVAHSDQPPQFTVREGSTLIGTHLLSASYGYLYATATQATSVGSSTLGSGESRLGFTFNSATGAGQGWVDWFEIFFPRYLWGSGEFLRFRSPDTTAIVEYQLQKFGAQPVILDVTDHSNVKMITGVVSNYVFRRPESGGAISEYCAAGSSAWKTPAAVQKIVNQNLRGNTDGADFIIVAAREFRAAADRLKAHREQAANGGLKTYVAEVEKVYNEFGGGLADPAAIRDFLKYAYDNWTPRPQFVLLLGQGSYDYKGILGSKSSYVPVWQTLESRDDIYSYSTDDFFAKLGVTDQPWLVVGRISARKILEADVAAEKIIRYDLNSDRDPWKMRTLFIGDDAWTSEGGEIGDRTLHSDDAETLSGSSFTPEEFEKRKIYIAEYPTVNTGQGRRKPGSYDAIIEEINRGVLLFNYSGHGRADLLAHEHIFETETSVPRLTNANKLAVFFLATCGFSQFDDPKSYTGSEILMNKPDGAAVGVVSATRKVYAGANAQLNQGTYRRIFKRDARGLLIVERPSKALFEYKLISGNNENDQKFGYMGDPTTRLQYPPVYATIDSINQEPVDSLGGAPRPSPIVLPSLSKVTVSGTVRGAGNQPDPTYNGRVTLLMNDATQEKVIVNFYPGYNWPYMATGGTIYRGDNSVQGGKFRATFIIPKDVAYADSTSRGRMVAYLSGPTGDGGAYTGNFRIGGTDSTVRDDGEGPEIQIYLNNRTYRSGDVVPLSSTLLVDLRDSAGINTSSSGIGHRIEVWVNNAAQSKDVTENYTSTMDNYREGTVAVDLGELPPGRNSLRVRAWDSFNNPSVAETYFTVASSDALTLVDVFNYPNPFNGSTFFTFRHNQVLPLNVAVKVYTVAGRPVRSLEWVTSGETYVKIPWDGRDEDGDLLANGVYLYKVVAKTSDGASTSEALGKLTIVK